MKRRTYLLLAALTMSMIPSASLGAEETALELTSSEIVEFEESEASPEKIVVEEESGIISEVIEAVEGETAKETVEAAEETTPEETIPEEGISITDGVQASEQTTELNMVTSESLEADFIKKAFGSEDAAVTYRIPFLYAADMVFSLWNMNLKTK